MRFRWRRLGRAAALTTAAALATAALAGCSAPRDAPAAAPAATVSSSRPAGIDADLIAAAFANRLDEVRALVRAGADVNAKDSSEQSAYLIATSEVGDDPRLLELTLAAGADVTATDSYNGTGLIRAAERGYPRIVARLLAAGVEADHVNRLGWTAVLEAVILGKGGPQHIETVRLLIDGGANVNVADSDGMSPLAHAQRRGQQEIAALLQAAGAAT